MSESFIGAKKYPFLCIHNFELMQQMYNTKEYRSIRSIGLVLNWS